MTSKKEAILEYLKDNPESAIARISQSIKSNFYLTSDLLYELEDEMKIERVMSNFKGTAWRLKK